MARLYLYTVLGALAQVEFPALSERFVEAKDEEGNVKKGPDDKPLTERAPFERATEEPGALHLRPGSTVLLTADELGHLEKKRPDIFRCLQGPLDAEPKAEEEAAAPEQSSGSNESSGGDASQPASSPESELAPVVDAAVENWSDEPPRRSGKRS